MDRLKVGDSAPDFTLKDHDGFTTKLSEFRGKTVVLYFYPKDFTPGCTTQACSFRDSFDNFKNKKVEIIGISTDSQESHKKFAEKNELSFRLLSDTDSRVSKLYGVWAKKAMGGNEFFGIKRTTFVIDPEGKIKHIFERIDLKNHARDVLEVV